MNYEKLMEKLLAGKKINARGIELGIGQRTLDRWVKGDTLPDCDGALIIAEATGEAIDTVVRSIAAKKAELRPERAKSFLRPAMASVLMAVSFVLVAATGLLPAGNANAASIDVGSKTTASAKFFSLSDQAPILQNQDEINRSDPVEQLQSLEYAIRRSMIVREDMDEAAEQCHVDEAEGVGIAVPDMPTKGELLSVVQTALRVAQTAQKS